MKDLVESIKHEFEAFATDATAQAEKNNKSAGSRARKSALKMMKDLKEFRKLSIEASK